MSRSPKTKQITSTQHALVREQLAKILKRIAANQSAQVTIELTKLIQKYPSLPEVNHVASSFYTSVSQRDKAIYYATRAVDLDSKTPQYQIILGTLLVQSDDHKKAIKHLEQAVAISPQSPRIFGPLGVAYLQTGRIADARKSFNQAIQESPNDHEAIMNLALLESDTANAHKAVELMRDAVARFPNSPILHDSLAMFSCYDDQLTPEEVFEIHQAFGQCVQSKVHTPKSYPNKPDTNKRIRIGFISPDFKEHSIAYFIEPIFEHLNKEDFEIVVYSTSSHGDATTVRLKSHASIWRDCTDGIAATHKRIVNDQVDILVELTGHFASNQLPIFGSKPTPVSITMIGYGNTTGLDSINTRIVDSITDPSPKADNLATEQLVRVDDCFLCYRPPVDFPAIQAPKPLRPFVFGSFNDLRKISPSTMRVWASILNENPDSQLLLKASRLEQQEVCDDVYSRFESLGISSSRIKLIGRTPTNFEHLDLYNQIDCALDTFPYTGTTTTCEALAMGVPTITLLGNAHAGRVSASLLTAAGRSDLVASSEQDYIELANKQARGGSYSLESRNILRAQLLSSPLTDGKSYTKKLESVFISLWKSWCETQQAHTEPTQ